MRVGEADACLIEAIQPAELLPRGIPVTIIRGRPFNRVAAIKEKAWGAWRNTVKSKLMMSLPHLCDFSRANRAETHVPIYRAEYVSKDGCREIVDTFPAP